MKFPFPAYRSFLPLCSFVTRDGFSDIPIPSLVDWIVASRSIIPEYPEYSNSILEPLTAIEANSGVVDFARRTNRLFLRASCMKQRGVYALVQSLSCMDPSQRALYDVKVVKPKGVLEVVRLQGMDEVKGDTVECVCDNSCGRYYVSERWR